MDKGLGIQGLVLRGALDPRSLEKSYYKVENYKRGSQVFGDQGIHFLGICLKGTIRLTV